jgi:hypothetical protein
VSSTGEGIPQELLINVQIFMVVLSDDDLACSYTHVMQGGGKKKGGIYGLKAE